MSAVPFIAGAIVIAAVALAAALAVAVVTALRFSRRPLGDGFGALSRAITPGPHIKAERAP